MKSYKDALEIGRKMRRERIMEEIKKDKKRGRKREKRRRKIMERKSTKSNG